MTGLCEELYRWSDDHWTEIVPGAPAWIDGRLLTVEDRGAARRLVLDARPLTPDDIQIRQVVQADGDGILAVASTDPTEQHLLHVTLDGELTWLTDAPGLHSAQTAGDVIVTSHVGLDHDGAVIEIRKGGERVGAIENLAETPASCPT